VNDYSANTPEHVDARDYLRPILSRWWLIVLVVGIATAVTYKYYERQPKVYDASTLLYVKSSSADAILLGSTTAPDAQQVADLATLVTSAPVTREVARRIHFQGDPRALTGSVSAASSKGSSFITITTQGGRPRPTAELANTFAKSFIDLQDRGRQTDAQSAVEVTKQQLSQLGNTPASDPQRSTLLDRLHRLQAIAAPSSSTSGIQQVNRAVTPRAATSPNPRRNAIFAFVVSLALAIAAALGLERLDRRIKRVNDLGAAFETEVLGEIPRIRKPAPIEDGHGDLPAAFREPFRTLRTLLGLAASEQPLRTLLITSASPREGKSTVARNLAITYREAGKRVLLIDSDLRKPVMDRLLPVESEPGLTEVLIGTRAMEEALQPVAVRARGLDQLAEVTARETTFTNGHHENGGVGELAVLTSGHRPPNPLELLSTSRMRAVLEQLSAEYDIVIIDSPPLLAVSDAVALITNVDGVLLVARPGSTTTDAAERVLAELHRIPDVRLLGVVANGVPGRRIAQRTYGGYYAKA
jgi:succinoglycan biosynthesis transport protein ExoP